MPSKPTPARRRSVKNNPGIYTSSRASGAKRYEVAYRDSDKRLRWETVEGGLAEAQARRDEVRGRKRKGETLAPKSSVTFEDYADAWLESATNLRPRTREDYKLKLERVKTTNALARLRLTDVRVSNLRTLIRALERAGYAPTTVRTTLTPISKCLGQAVKDGQIGTNPCALLDREDKPKPESREHRILSPDEIAALLGAATSPRYRVLLATAAMTGLRQMELLGLTWGDVDLDALEIRVRFQLSRTPGHGRVAPKTEKAKRDVAIPPALAHELRKHRASTIYKAPEDYVFTTDTGGPLGWSNVDRYALASAVKAAKLRAPLPRFHDLRHSFASAAIAQGQDVVYVSGQLGHAGTDITLRVYAGEFAKAQHAEKHRDSMEATFGAILSGNTLETAFGQNESEPVPAEVVALR